MRCLFKFKGSFPLEVLTRPCFGSRAPSLRGGGGVMSFSGTESQASQRNALNPTTIQPKSQCLVNPSPNPHSSTRNPKDPEASNRKNRNLCSKLSGRQPELKSPAALLATLTVSTTTIIAALINELPGNVLGTVHDYSSPYF